MRSRRALALSLLALLLAAAIASTAGAQGIRPAPGAPDPRQIVLTAADLGGAKVVGQGYYRERDVPSVISYAREFENGRSQGTRFLSVDSAADVGVDAETTAQFLSTLRRALATNQGRALFKRAITSSLPKDGVATNVQVGRPRALGLGPDAFDLLVTFRLLGLRTEIHLTMFAVERALGTITSLGLPGSRIARAQLLRLGRLMSARMTTQLTPRNTALPAITGVAHDTATLTASTGTWSGAPTTFTYQWQRCDAAGANCADVVGATAATYLVTTAEVGTTLRVTVTGQNGVAATAAVSAQTPVVLAATPAP
ncbi:MAG TPA: hypothetical protein VEW90_00250 [Gaiellaceae bacterium]|nr:hypothetical protein [Gaiellaceae bacterium]